MIAWSTLFDAENVFRLLPVGVPRSMEENVPQKNQNGLYMKNQLPKICVVACDLC